MGKKFENSQFLIPNSELVPAYARLEWREAFGAKCPEWSRDFPAEPRKAGLTQEKKVRPNNS